MSKELLVDGAHVSYGRAAAVIDASLTVRPGTVSALVGPNGAGKSSLVQLLVGAVRGKTKEITLGGLDLTKLSVAERARAGITLVPQGRQLFPRLTILENLQVIADALDLDPGVVEGALDRFPILRTRQSSIAGVLSGGERQMLAIARGLMSDPRVLILDEPTLGLAPVIVGELLETVVALREEGVGVLIVEPSMHNVPEQIDHGGVMIRGRVTPVVGGHAVLSDRYRNLLGLGAPAAPNR